MQNLGLQEFQLVLLTTTPVVENREPVETIRVVLLKRLLLDYPNAQH